MYKLPRVSSLVLLLLAAVGGALIWALSPAIAGAAEPWDSDSPYYIVALAILGVVLGVLSIRLHAILAIAVGAWLGQVLYILIARETGPFLLVGLGFLAAYLIPLIIGASAAVGVRLSYLARKHSGSLES